MVRFMANRDYLIYISGKYTDDNYDGIDRNIKLARDYAIKLWEIGLTAICPHLNTYHFEENKNISYNDYINGDLEILNRCDGVFMLPNYLDSNGAIMELEEARKNGKEIFFSLEEVVKRFTDNQPSLFS